MQGGAIGAANYVTYLSRLMKKRQSHSEPLKGGVNIEINHHDDPEIKRQTDANSMMQGVKVTDIDARRAWSRSWCGQRQKKDPAECNANA